LIENASEFLAAGAVGVGLSSELFPKKLVNSGDWEAIGQLAKTLMQKLVIAQ
jgi:2-dehydro-3-deoxyphosphogluconate aldolase / (4S)-4-hydroxy-2-oxoglutarate aldolase